MDLTITIDFLSKQWIINMIITIICSFLFFIFASKTNKENLSYFLKISSFLVLAMTVANHLILILNDSWTLKNNLPIHLCSISALICCFIGFIKNKQLLFEFLFYAGIIGGILSLLTPQITLYKELNFFYIMFYFKHASIIAIPIFMRFYMNIKLSKFSWLKVFGLINLLLAIVLPINSAIDSNYLYVSRPPMVNNPLIIEDFNKFFGIPTYVYYWEIIMIILLILIYYLFRQKKTATF